MSSSPSITIDGRPIGREHPPYIIAELSANHNGSLQHALDAIAVAKDCGADAIKVQTYTPDTMTLDLEGPGFSIEDGLWKGKTLYQLYQEAHTPFEWMKPLFDEAKKNDITIFSSPFDETAIELLEELNTPAYKVASFELPDHLLIKKMAQLKKPMILSTGMANLEEISEAVNVASEHGCSELALLHCISAYPAPINEANLKTLIDLESRFDHIIGLSDHTLGTSVSVSAVALGASVIEKHFTIRRSDGGPDSSFSLEPQELKRLCVETKEAWSSLGKVDYDRKESEKQNIRFRRSIYFSSNLKAGSTIQAEHLRRIRPGFGLAPKHWETLIGKRIKADVSVGTPTSWDLLE